MEEEEEMEHGEELDHMVMMQEDTGRMVGVEEMEVGEWVHK